MKTKVHVLPFLKLQPFFGHKGAAETSCKHSTDIHPSAITLKPMTGQVNGINYLITMAHIKEWDILGSK